MERDDVSAREVWVAGLRIPILEAGPSTETEATVFVHGNPGSACVWRDLLQRLS